MLDLRTAGGQGVQHSIHRSNSHSLNPNLPTNKPTLDSPLRDLPIQAQTTHTLVGSCDPVITSTSLGAPPILPTCTPLTQYQHSTNNTSRPSHNQHDACRSQVRSGLAPSIPSTSPQLRPRPQHSLHVMEVPQRDLQLTLTHRRCPLRLNGTSLPKR